MLQKLAAAFVAAAEAELEQLFAAPKPLIPPGELSVAPRETAPGYLQFAALLGTAAPGLGCSQHQS